MSDAPTQEQIEEVKRLWAEQINQAIESGNLNDVRLDIRGPLFGGIASTSAEKRRQNLLNRFKKTSSKNAG